MCVCVFVCVRVCVCACVCVHMCVHTFTGVGLFWKYSLALMVVVHSWSSSISAWSEPRMTKEMQEGRIHSSTSAGGSCACPLQLTKDPFNWNVASCGSTVYCGRCGLMHTEWSWVYQ